MRNRRTLFLALIAALMLAACGGSGDSGSSAADPGIPGGSSNSEGNSEGSTAGRVFTILPTAENPTEEARIAFIKAGLGDTIKFGCGFFNIKDTLLLTATEGVTITGCGMNKTILSFNSSTATVGILVNNARGIVIKNLTVADTGGDGIVMRSVDHGTISHVRVFWSSGGGRFSKNPLTAKNYQDMAQPGEEYWVKCKQTSSATQDPDAPLSQFPGSDTTSPYYTVSDKSGRYGIYPVKSSNILIEYSVSVGASDAGIYVGQTDNAIIRHSRAAYNVFGFEIENVRHGEYAYNVAECNTGGFLIYDLANLTQYGQRTIMHHNISRWNNTYNFSAGGFVAKVPPGSGMITLAYDRIDIYENKFIGNNTAGIIHTSYEIFPEGGQPTDNKIDFYTEGVRIFHNFFKNNGNNLPNVNLSAVLNGDVSKLLPTVIGVKIGLGCLLPQNLLKNKCPILTNPSQGIVLRGAHIIWDGLLPKYNADCPYPTKANGEPVPEDPFIEGKPWFNAQHPNPDCHYNKYKFKTNSAGEVKRDADGEAIRKKPLFFSSCIFENTFVGDSVKYANFHGTKGLEALLILLGDNPLQKLLKLDTLKSVLGGLTKFVADFNINIHDCQARFGETLEPIEGVTIPPFVPSGNFPTAPTDEEIAQLCNMDVAPNEVNWAATAVNCPRLAQYNLFANPHDPTSQPNGRGFPYVLNTKLFSDYAVKYRVLFLPPGKQAIYAAPGASAPQATIKFPVGTVIAKTFSFVHADMTETHIETRLLIKRETPNGGSRWKGLPYVWKTIDGKRVAELDVTGKDHISVSWHYKNADSGKILDGQTDSYSVPSANQCLTCHANANRPAGSPPIGPKVRNMNRAYESESPVMTAQSKALIRGHNQIKWMCSHGLMTNCPDIVLGGPGNNIATNLPRIPKFNIPGDSGFSPRSDKDIEARVRAYLESNCAHCHNPRGFAANSGLYLDSFGPVDTSYGICKEPTAAGKKGTGGRQVDIKPGSAAASIMTYRIGPAAQGISAAMMPPIARSVVHEQAYQLIRKWINTVVDASYPGASCVGG